MLHISIAYDNLHEAMDHIYGVALYIHYKALEVAISSATKILEDEVYSSSVKHPFTDRTGRLRGSFNAESTRISRNTVSIKIEIGRGVEAKRLWRGKPFYYVGAVNEWVGEQNLPDEYSLSKRVGTQYGDINIIGYFLSEGRIVERIRELYWDEVVKLDKMMTNKSARSLAAYAREGKKYYRGGRNVSL